MTTSATRNTVQLATTLMQRSARAIDPLARSPAGRHVL